MEGVQRACALCSGGAKAHGGSLGPLLGPIGQVSELGGGFYIHKACALWSPEVYQPAVNKLKMVLPAIRRGRQIRCAHCGNKGATVGCRIDRCQQSFHLPCAKVAGCKFNPRKYVVACPSHAEIFAHEDAGYRPTPVRGPTAPTHQPPASLVGAKRSSGRTDDEAAAKRSRGGLDGAHMSSHIATARLALRELKKQMADRDDDDEVQFELKERKRLAKDVAKLRPVLLGGATAGAPGEGAQPHAASAGFAAIGGLEDVKRSLREMVLLPLTAPGLFASMGITPPKGILLHGAPGCGKTALVRALAGEVAKRCPGRVALFARKGADCLGKYAGDAERTLRLLFQQARDMAPSIIFLDELDALVPARSVRAGTSDQIYASVVSTLLALMDGVGDRGQVVVIGATNRPEGIDPALRRPGRFDREVYFGLPSAADREAILKVLTRSWTPNLEPHLLAQVAAATDGYAGADLQALCSAAVLAAVRRAVPAAAFDAWDAPAVQTASPAMASPGGKGHHESRGHAAEAAGAGAAAAGQAHGLQGLQAMSDGEVPVPAGSQPQASQSSPGQHVDSPTPAIDGTQPTASPSTGAHLCADELASVPAPAPSAAAAAAAAGAHSPGPAVNGHLGSMGTGGGFLAALELCAQEVGATLFTQRDSDATGSVLPSQPMDTSDGATQIATPEGPSGFDPLQSLAGTASATRLPAEQGTQGAPTQPSPSDTDASRGASQEATPPSTHAHAAAPAAGAEAGAQPDAANATMPQLPAPAPPPQWLQELVVLPQDWGEALATAAPPCSKREAAATLGQDVATSPLQHHLTPLLLPAVAAVLAQLVACGAQLPPGVLSAVEGRVERAAQPGGVLEQVMQRCGAVQLPPSAADASTHVEGAEASAAGATSSGRDGSNSNSSSSVPCHILLSGDSDAGQEAAAGVLLRLLGGAGAVVRSLALPALVLHGQGDPVEGCMALVREGLARAGRGQTLVLHVPRLEAWAVSPCEEDSMDDAQHPPKHSQRPHLSLPSASGGIEAAGRAAVAVPALSPVLVCTSPPHGAKLPAPALWNQQPPRHTSISAADEGSEGSSISEGNGSPQSDDEVLQDEDTVQDKQERQRDASSVQATTVSPAWTVFEQLVAGAGPAQPIVVLATCHGASELLPQQLRSFFTRQQQQQQQQQQLVDDRMQEGAATALQVHGGIVQLLSASSQALQEAIRRAAAAAAASVQQRPLHVLAHAAAPKAAASKTGATSKSQHDQQQHQQQQQQHQQQQQQDEHESDEPLAGANLNEAQWDEASRMFARVRSTLQSLGAALLQDPRTKQARARARLRHLGAAGAVPKPASLAGVRARAYAGAYTSLDVFLWDVKVAVQAVRASHDLAPGHYSGSAAAASALEDLLECTCAAVNEQLGLHQPQHAALLLAAEQRFKQQQREQQPPQPQQQQPFAQQPLLDAIIDTEPEPQQQLPRHTQAGLSGSDALTPPKAAGEPGLSPLHLHKETQVWLQTMDSALSTGLLQHGQQLVNEQQQQRSRDTADGCSSSGVGASWIGAMAAWQLLSTFCMAAGSPAADAAARALAHQLAAEQQQHHSSMMDGDGAMLLGGLQGAGPRLCDVVVAAAMEAVKRPVRMCDGTPGLQPENLLL